MAERASAVGIGERGIAGGEMAGIGINGKKGRMKKGFLPIIGL
jgi:hypothetical protein